MAQNDKKLCLSFFIFQESYPMILIYGTLVWNDDITRSFFYFFKILIFWVFRGGVCDGVKGQKTILSEKKFCLSHSICLEPYIIWFSFMVHMCKMIISPGVFFIFSKFWFFRLLGGSKGKKWPKMTKNSVCRVLYLRNHTSYDLHLWYTCVIG